MSKDNKSSTMTMLDSVNQTNNLFNQIYNPAMQKMIATDNAIRSAVTTQAILSNSFTQADKINHTLPDYVLKLTGIEHPINRNIIDFDSENSNLFKDVQNSIVSRDNRATEQLNAQLETNYLLELQNDKTEELIELTKQQSIFLENISQDSKQLVSLITNLEQITIQNGNITQEMQLEIQQQLIQIKENTAPEKLHEAFIGEVKNNFMSRGVDFGISTLMIGLKLFLTQNT